METETSTPPMTMIDVTQTSSTDPPVTETTLIETPETETTTIETEPPTEPPDAEPSETEPPETEPPVTDMQKTEPPPQDTEAPDTETTVIETTTSNAPESESIATDTLQTETTVTEDILQSTTGSSAGSTLAGGKTKSSYSQPEWISDWFTRSTQPRTTQKFEVTQYFAINAAIESDIFDNIHKVKDVAIIKDFSIHILRQTMQVFESIKNKIDDTKTKRKIDFLSRSYKKKFSDFVLETQNHNVRTRLGTQKVVLNTIDTSNRILKRLTNYFVGDVNKNPALRDEGLGNIVESEVKKEIALEYQHACKKFGICRSSEGFQKFLIDVLNELLKSDNKKLRDANDALTEAIKNTDLSKVVDSELQKKVNQAIFRLETMDTKFIRPMYTMWRNAIGLRNKPISVMDGVKSNAVNKTVAFLDIIDTLDLHIKPTEKNVMAWVRVKHNLSQWTVGIMEGTYSIMKEFVKVIMDEVNKFDMNTAQSINEKLTIVLMDVVRMGYDYQIG